MRIFLGIDGGATKTRAMLVNARGAVLGEGASGPSNYHNVGLPAATKNLRLATNAAWKAANLPRRPADVAFLGCAGIRAAIDIARLTAMVETVGLAAPEGVTVRNDLYNALAGGLAGRAGIALIAGTGTNCLGQNESGDSYMCGGWGWLVDDVGGGFGLAIAAIRASARAIDGRGRPTRLLPALLAYLGLSDPDEIMARLYVEDWRPDELAAFAPLVMRVAAEGDPVAVDILQEGANALAELVAGTMKSLEFNGPPEVVVLGGCGRSGPPYQPMIEKAIRTICPKARLVEPALSPVAGAALNALRVGGVDPEMAKFINHREYAPYV